MVLHPRLITCVIWAPMALDQWTTEDAIGFAMCNWNSTSSMYPSFCDDVIEDFNIIKLLCWCICWRAQRKRKQCMNLWKSEAITSHIVNTLILTPDNVLLSVSIKFHVQFGTCTALEWWWWWSGVEMEQ